MFPIKTIFDLFENNNEGTQYSILKISHLNKNEKTILFYNILAGYGIFTVGVCVLYGNCHFR